MEPETPYLISRGRYRAATGVEILPLLPLEKMPGLDRDSNNNYQYLVRNVTATGNVTGCVGVSLQYKANTTSTGTLTTPAGKGAYRREIRVLQFGPIDMLFSTGQLRQTGYLGDWVAPHPSGFMLWNTGLQKMGYLLDDYVVKGEFAKVFIDLSREPFALVSGVLTGAGLS